MTLQQKFDKLVKQWKKDTQVYSVCYERYQHPAHKAIVAMGEKAIPLILRELEARHDRWYYALTMITNQSPDFNCKNFITARLAWLKWGVRNGYLSPSTAVKKKRSRKKVSTK